MATFYLKVVNPVIASGYGNNVNWSKPPGESVPDRMPTETSAVAFINAVVPGRFKLWSGRGAAGGGYEYSPVHGHQSPEFTPQDGATYIWDMQANTIDQEIQSQENPMAITKYPGNSVMVNARISYVGAGGDYRLEMSMSKPDGTSIVIPSTGRDFTLQPASTTNAITVTVTGTIVANAPTGLYTIWLAIWDRPRGASAAYQGSVANAVQIYGGTTFSAVTATVS